MVLVSHATTLMLGDASALVSLSPSAMDSRNILPFTAAAWVARVMSFTGCAGPGFTVRLRIHRKY